MREEATAFVPGHVTGFSAPIQTTIRRKPAHEARD